MDRQKENFLATRKSYLIGLKPVFRLKFWDYFAHNTRKIILCDMSYKPREISYQH